MVESPPVQKQPTLRIAVIVLCVLAVGWLIATVIAAAPHQPVWAALLGIATLLFTPLLVIGWVILVILRMVSRRSIGIVGWLVVPLVLAAAWLPPWREWQYQRTFNESRPALQTLIAEFESLPVGSDVHVNRRAGPFEVLWVRRHDGCTLLVMHRTPDGEAGLVYSPSGTVPQVPTWAVTHHYDRVDDTWWRYGWWDE